MHLGFSNAHNTFMCLMNHCLKPFIEKFVVFYFDDIFVDKKEEKQHLDHLFHVFIILREKKLYVNLNKCQIFLDSLISLRYVVMNDGIKMD